MKPPRDQLTVLLVQSDARRRVLLAAGLRRRGMTVVEHPCAEAALEALRTRPAPAVIVTEPAFGRLTELELLDQIQDAAPRLVVVFTHSADRGRLALPPDAHVLAQPFGPEQLSRFIRLVAVDPALRNPHKRQSRQTMPSALAALGVIS